MENNTSTCANCGKGEEDANKLKTCNACKMVKYCNSNCQKAHRPDHKKECKKRAAELHEKALFQQPPPNEECPICMIILPSRAGGKKYQTCCGKTLCCGCMIASLKSSGGEPNCPFCRTPPYDTMAENNARLMKRVNVNDANALYNLGCKYDTGTQGFPVNHAKAHELWHRAGKLGRNDAYYSIGIDYMHGSGGVVRDMKKARYYWELAAIKGNCSARHNLGMYEHEFSRNTGKAMKHYLIAASTGSTNSLIAIQNLYRHGIATKNDYTKAMDAYQAFKNEIKSKEREEAAAVSDDYRYFDENI